MRPCRPLARRFLCPAVFLSLVLLAGQQVRAEDRFWILWERIARSGSDCPDGATCRTQRDYASRIFTPDRTDWLYRLFGATDGHSPTGAGTAEHPEAPRICQDHSGHAGNAGPDLDPERQFLSDPVDALRGLRGIGMDIGSMRPPPGFSSTFGSDLQTEFEQRLKQAGLIVLDPSEAARLPGQPKLSVFFSHTDPDAECLYTYSVFASLRQTALLSRDLQTKLSVGVWSFSTRPSAEYPDDTEYDAILRVVDAFIADYKRANGSP